MHLSTRLSLTLHAGLAQGIETLVPYLARREELRPAYQPLAVGLKTAHIERTIDRLIIRTERVETTTLPSITQDTFTQSSLRRSDNVPASIQPQPITPPVPRIFQRASQPVPADAAGPLRSASGLAGSASQLATPSGAFVTQPTEAGQARDLLDFKPGDINRLTERVIEAIDHRITAQRERLGRM
jgi:hypothetical protein